MRYMGWECETAYQYVVLAYMTGILPIKKYGEHSALNMFDEYSMTNQRELAVGKGYADSDSVNYKKHECMIEKIRIQ